jgi:hypothetical protein
VGSSTEAPRSSAAMWASAGYFASTPTTAPTLAPTTAPTSHGHWRRVGNSSRSGGCLREQRRVSSSSTHGGQARHAPLWARNGTLSAAARLLFEVRVCPSYGSPFSYGSPWRCRASGEDARDAGSGS